VQPDLGPSNRPLELVGEFFITLLVHGDNVAGIYDTELTALAEGAALFKKEPFLVRPIQLQNEEVSAPAYTLEILNCRS
jgi:hypothetical protein